MRSDAAGARNLLALFGVPEDEVTPEAFAGAQRLATATRIFIQTNTEKPKARRGRRRR